MRAAQIIIAQSQWMLQTWIHCREIGPRRRHLSAVDEVALHHGVLWLAQWQKAEVSLMPGVWLSYGICSSMCRL